MGVQTDLTLAVYIMNWQQTFKPDEFTDHATTMCWLHKRDGIANVLYSTPFKVSIDDEPTQYDSRWEKWQPTSDLRQAWLVLGQVMAQPSDAIATQQTGARARVAAALSQAHLYTLNEFDAAQAICGLIVDAYGLNLIEIEE